MKKLRHKAQLFYILLSCKMIRPVGGATGAHPGIAKLLAML